MTPADLEGAVFGPTDVHLHADRVAEYVTATGDDPDRWVVSAPPGIAALLLFAVAGELLWDDRIAEHTKTLLHIDQSFTYHGALPVGSVLTVRGEVTKVRERAGAFFVSFAATAEGEDDAPLVESTSTFLMSSTPATEASEALPEPPPSRRASNGAPTPLPAVVGPMPDLERSASRGDLVRYAATTRDFNPIHWDHDSAVGAGAPGVIVHGLLMLAWMLQHAARLGHAAAPIAHVKVRFRALLRPAEQAIVTGTVVEVANEKADASVKAAIRRGDEDLVTGAVIVRAADA